MKKNALVKMMPLFLAAGMLLSCGGNNSSSNGGDGSDGNSASSGASTDYDALPSTKNLKIGIVKMGYGVQWLKDMTNAFKSEANINITISEFPGQAGADALATAIDGGGDYDLVFTKRGSFESDIYTKKSVKGYSPLYEDITETVYGYTNPGEDKTIAEKMSEDMKDYYGFDGHYYGVPWTSGFMGIARNKTLWEAMGYTDEDIPLTTNELMDICDDIYSRKYVYPGSNPVSGQVYPFIYSDKAEYYTSICNIWTAQYEGKDNMTNYFMKGYGPGETTSNENFYTFDGQVAALKVIEGLLTGNDGHRQDPTTSIDFTTAQAYFYQASAMFSVNGSWLESESGYEGVDVDFFKTPVTSDLVNKMSIKNDADADEKLSAAIAYVDSHDTDGADAPLSAEDMAIVRDARNYSYLGGGNDHQGFITAFAKNKKNAISFLRYMFSDAGLNSYRNTMNGLFLPATPCVAYGELANKPSVFRQSVIDALSDGQMFYESRKAKFFCLGNVDLHFQNGTGGRSIVSMLKGSNSLEKLSVEEIMNKNYDYIKTWLADIIDNMNRAK